MLLKLRNLTSLVAFAVALAMCLTWTGCDNSNDGSVAATEARVIQDSLNGCKGDLSAKGFSVDGLSCDEAAEVLPALDSWDKRNFVSCQSPNRLRVEGPVDDTWNRRCQETLRAILGGVDLGTEAISRVDGLDCLAKKVGLKEWSVEVHCINASSKKRSLFLLPRIARECPRVVSKGIAGADGLSCRRAARIGKRLLNTSEQDLLKCDGPNRLVVSERDGSTMCAHARSFIARRFAAHPPRWIVRRRKVKCVTVRARGAGGPRAMCEVRKGRFAFSMLR